MKTSVWTGSAALEHHEENASDRFKSRKVAEPSQLLAGWQES